MPKDGEFISSPSHIPNARRQDAPWSVKPRKSISNVEFLYTSDLKFGFKVDLHSPYPDHSVSPQPSYPVPTAGEITPMTPVGHVMAGCWQINYILTNIGRRNIIRI